MRPDAIALVVVVRLSWPGCSTITACALLVIRASPGIRVPLTSLRPPRIYLRAQS